MSRLPGEHVRKFVRGRGTPVVCPAAWQLLHHLVNNTWGIAALLQLAEFVAGSRNFSVVASTVSIMLPMGADGTAAAGMPPGVSTSGMQTLRPKLQTSSFEGASAVRCVCSQPIQLLNALKDMTAAALLTLSTAETSAPVMKELLQCTSKLISTQAFTALVSVLVSPDAQCRSAAEALVVNLPAAQEVVQNSDALQKGVVFLLSTECSSILLSAFGDHLHHVETFLQQNSQASLMQLCQGDACTLQPVISFAAPLLACSISDDGSMVESLEPIAISCWSISKSILDRMALLDMHTELSTQSEALLVASLRAMAIVWETHKSSVLNVSSDELPKSLSFLSLLLSVPRYFPNMTRTLSEVWGSCLMTVTSELPTVPWPKNVRETATGFVANVDGNVPSFIRKHIAGLLGSSAPGNMSRLAAGQALSDLPAQKTAPKTPPQKSKNLSIIDLTENEDASPPRPKPTSKKTNADTSPLLRAWSAAEGRKASAGVDKAGPSQPGFSGGRKVSALNFARTGPNVGKEIVRPGHAMAPLPSGKKTVPPDAQRRTQEQQQWMNVASTSAGTAPGAAAAARAASASAAPKAGSWHATAPKPSAGKKLKERKKRLRDIIDHDGGDSDSDQFDSDEDEWRKKARPAPSRPFQPGATHVVVNASKNEPNQHTAGMIFSLFCLHMPGGPHVHIWVLVL